MTSIDFVVSQSDVDLAPSKFLLIQDTQGLFGVLEGVHLDERASFGSTSLAVDQDLRSHRLQTAAVHVLHQGLLVDPEIQIGQIDHGVLVNANRAVLILPRVSSAATLRVRLLIVV